MGVLAVFPAGTYTITGTMCVESEKCYEKYHKKTNDLLIINSFIINRQSSVKTYNIL